MNQRNFLGLFGWILDLLTFFFKIKIHHEDLRPFLEMNTQAPSCYVLRVNSLWDFIVLYKICLHHRLPMPYFKLSFNMNASQASCFGLQRQGLFQSVKDIRKSLPPSLSQNITILIENPKLNLNIIPVSIFWGRNPGTEDRASLLKLLFFDDERAGRLQKFLIVLFQCRNIQVSFGKSTQLRDVIEDERNPEMIMRKLRRLLRVHFHKVRVSVLGPELYKRSQVANWILRSAPIKTLLEHDSKGDRNRYLRLEKEAARYVYEISAEIFFPVIRFFEITLGWLFNRIYDKFHIINGDQLRHSTVGHEVIYLPCHRSHIDYLVSSFVIHKFGINRPHTGAGNNLNFWPAGVLIRRGGGFFLRRSFGGNRLYAAVFTEYIHYLITKGHPLQFFIEGGRSRSGLFLKPKLGILSMVLQSYAREQTKPVQIVPICVGYDRIFEIDSYFKELQGEKKKRESFGQLLRAKKILMTSMGGVYVNFGQPLLLDNILDKIDPNWKAQSSASPMERPEWLSHAVHELGDQVMQEISKLSIINPVTIVATLLLAMPQKAAAENEARVMIQGLIQLIKQGPWGESVNIPFTDPSEILQWAVRYSDINIHESPAGNVIFLSPDKSHKYTYYRNNMLGVFSVYGLIALYAELHDGFEVDTMIKHSETLLDFLGPAFTIPRLGEGYADLLKRHLQVLVKSGLLTEGADGRIKSSDYFSTDNQVLRLLANTVRPFCERIAITALYLSRQPQKPFNEVIKHAHAVSDRSALLSGANIHSPSDQGVVSDFVQYLKKNNYISIGSNESLIAKEKFNDLATHLENFLDKNIAGNLQRQFMDQDI